MEAVIFDIDGTLIDSDKADGVLFITAAEQVLGIGGVRSDWTTYRHVTDQGVLNEIMHDHGIAPSQDLIDATRHTFIELLREHTEEHGAFVEIPGAIDYVRRLLQSDAHYVAYATGAWRESALLKLESAGLPTDGIPLSTSSEFEDRVSIMTAALSAAPDEIERISYFGDGVWDRTAAGQLGWEFVPVGAALNGIRDYHHAG